MRSGSRAWQLEQTISTWVCRRQHLAKPGQAALADQAVRQNHGRVTAVEPASNVPAKLQISRMLGRRSRRAHWTAAAAAGNESDAVGLA